ncbi:hypothetical protein N8I77_009313 [Diaporthe amygdali]|uniref:Uncharacterized protein n=1 Tax=Phomopsis amygdali TaxID=1214568 RepID=A0AAD9W0K4_PHOAM|nr:hypothetical protein N8I77_009313 [Diaporthe amygdali]
MQDPNSPWAMDLNTTVTIVFGILSLILQAGQFCYGRRQISRLPTQQDDVVHGAAFEIPDIPMPQRVPARQLPIHRGSARSMRPPQRSSPIEASHIRPARQDRTPDGYGWPPPAGTFRRRNPSQFSSSGQWGGGPSLSDRGWHPSQYNHNRSARYLEQGCEN